MAYKTIPLEQLGKGMYVLIDLHWSKHPFIRNAFLVKTDAELATIRALGLTQVRIDTERCSPQAMAGLARVEQEIQDSQTADDSPKVAANQEPVVCPAIQQRQKKMAAAERSFHDGVNRVKTVLHDLARNPSGARQASGALVEDMLSTILRDTNVAVQLVNSKKQSERRYMHVMNVLVLSLIVGEKLGLDQEGMRALGLGALYHDIGVDYLPDRLRLKSTRFTDAEFQLYKTHPDLGAKSASRCEHVPAGALAIIGQHHEKLDGSGYPKGLKGDQIHPMAKIVSLVDSYDHLVNGLNQDRKMTPHDVVSRLYADKCKYDAKVLAALISAIGVYPPGSVVKLSDGHLAVVTAVNSEALLSPEVLVYDEAVPREQAKILDLAEEDDLSIVANLQRDSLPQNIQYYLDLDISGYYVD